MIHRYWEGPPSGRSVPVPEATDWVRETLPFTAPVGEDFRWVANVVRFRLLWTFGGLWLDHDIRVLRPGGLDALCRGPLWVACVGRQPEAGVMWAPGPREPDMRRAWRLQEDRPDLTASEVLSRVLAPSVPRRDIYSVGSDGRPRPGRPEVEPQWETTVARRSGRVG